jgi:molybdopterin synthase catalytic subunit
MAILIWDFALTQAALALPPHPASADAGAVVDFLGIVRGIEDNAAIVGIEYEWHPQMAQSQLERIGRETAERFPLLPGCLLHHRVGFVPVGKASLFARVAAPHRAEAVRAVEWLVDELKKRVPIWKQPRFKVDPGGPVSPMKTPATTHQ